MISRYRKYVISSPKSYFNWFKCRVVDIVELSHTHVKLKFCLSQFYPEEEFTSRSSTRSGLPISEIG